MVRIVDATLLMARCQLGLDGRGQSRTVPRCGANILSNAGMSSKRIITAARIDSFDDKSQLDNIALQCKVLSCRPIGPSENLKVIRTLMERGAVYRRALAPLMGAVGLTGLAAAVAAALVQRAERPAPLPDFGWRWP